MLISESDLSVRSKNALINAGYINTEEIYQIKESDLKKIKNLGEKSVKEIINFKPHNVQKYNLKNLSFNELKTKSIEYITIENSLYILLKNNNIQTVGVFLELKKEDLKKFRGINKNEIMVLLDIISNIRNDLNMNYCDVEQIVFTNNYVQIKQAISDALYIKDSENLNFYFRDKKKLKTEIELNCIDAKDSEIKKIMNLSLNNVETFIKFTPRNVSGLSNNKLEKMVKTLLNKLVVMYNDKIIYEPLEINFLRKHKFKFWLNIEENILLSITQKIKKIINNYIDVTQYGFNELVYFVIENNEINKEIRELKLNIIESKEIVYKYVKEYSNKMKYEQLKDNFENVNSQIDFNKIFNMVESDGLFVLDGMKVKVLDKSLLDYAKQFKPENQYLALNYRLQGQTLQEVGENLNLTRERARQLIKKALIYLPGNVKESRNSYWFENYNLNRTMFYYLFEDDGYNYLTLKYDEGEEPWENILYDERADDSLKRKVTTKLQENQIILGEVSIIKKRLPILRYIIRNYCENITTHRELEELYSLFIEENIGTKEGLELDNRYVEARISDQDIVVERPKKQFRFYDYNEFDWELFYEELGLIEWMDMDLSTELIFNSNEQLMKDYNILNKYELHNIMKRTQKFIKEVEIKFVRTPHIIIGEADRNQQVKNLLFENSPIKKEQLAELYSKVYGVNKGSILANYFGAINEYLVNDTYIVRNIEISEDILNKLIEIVDNQTIIFVDDIRNEISIKPSMVTLYLNQLGYKKYANYYISDYYNNTTELFDELYFEKYEIIDAYKIPLKIWHLSSFGSQLFKKIYSMELVEFDNHKYINIKKLSKIGLDKELFIQFRKEVLNLLKDNEYWSLSNILEVIDTTKIDEFGFDNIFYRSILRGVGNIYSQRISNNYLFKLNEPVSLKSFLYHIINDKKIIDIYNLLSFISDTYNINIEKYKVIAVIQDLGMYYDEIMEKIYLDIYYYYEEFL